MTEGRAVLHMALRGGAAAPGGDDVAGTLERFLAFAETVRPGAGHRCDQYRDRRVGSRPGDGGSAALRRHDRDGPTGCTSSRTSIGAHFLDTVAGLDPARTLVIVASKTFTTLETMANAELARDMAGAHAGGQDGRRLDQHRRAVPAFGIPEDRVFGFWDWVGGRYSVWGAIGLPVAIGVGAAKFRAFLAGAAAMDRHYREAPLAENLPVLLALAAIWRRNVMGLASTVVAPYCQRLARLPAYLQQLEMESNGKSVRRDGTRVPRHTCPVIWGEPGTNAQHSFFQLLHQGTEPIAVDFIAATAVPGSQDHGHRLLMANLWAQATALAFGSRADPGFDPAEANPHRFYGGNRPSTTITIETLDAHHLGQLIALFEHKVHACGAIWGINSFDQWGVELGKKLTKTALER